MPLLAKRIIASFDCKFSPRVKCDFWLMNPNAELPKSIVFGLIIPDNVGVSPPAHKTPDKLHAFPQPLVKSSKRFLFFNHSESPTAQYANIPTGRDPTVIRSLMLIATVSCAIWS